MVFFGLASSAFDFLTFGTLLYVFRAGEAEFQSGWFVVSLITELAVVMVLRTRRWAWRSKPGRLLTVTTLGVCALAIIFPFTGLPARVFGLVPLRVGEFAALLGIVVGYVVATELLKSWFYRGRGRRRPSALGREQT